MTRRMLVKTGDAAIMAKVKPTTVRDWVSRGHIKRYRNGMVDLAEIHAYMTRRAGHVG